MVLGQCHLAIGQFKQITLPKTFVLSSTISGNTLTLKSFDKTFTYTSVPLEGSTIYKFTGASLSNLPELVIVGEISYNCINPPSYLCPDNAVFSTTKPTIGSVKSFVDVGGKWSMIVPSSETVIPSGQASTAETSQNLQWRPSRGNLEVFSNDKSNIDNQGVAYVPAT
jgi:hypothetical protein